MATKTASKTCFCNHCKKDGFKRSQLNEELLCATCAAIPGVRGWRDPNKRGLQSGSQAYWDATKGQLHVIGDEQPSPASPGASGAKHLTVERWDDGSGAFVVEYDGPAPLEEPGGTLEQWRKNVFASQDVNSDAKVLLLKLADHADWTALTVGGNCFPSISTLAEALGWTKARVLRSIEGVRGSWVTVHGVERWNGRTIERTSNLYELRWPDGRRLRHVDKRMAS